MGIVTVKLITNTIGIEQYGLYGKVAEFGINLAVAANLGLFGNTVRKMSPKPKDGTLFISALALRLGVGLLVFGMGMIYTFIYIQNPLFQLGLLFLLSSLLFEFASSICNATLQVNYKMGRATFAMLMGRLLELSIVIYMTRLEALEFYPLFFLAPLAAAALTTCINLYFVKKEINWSWRPQTQIMKALFWTALPFGIINILNNLYYRFFPSFVAGQELSDAQFGSYSIILAMTSTASLLSTFLMFSTLPAFKKALEEGHYKRAQNLYKIAQKTLLIFAPLAILGGLILGPWAIKIVSNENFVKPEMWLPMLLLIVLASLSYFYDLILITLFALEKDIWLLKREFIALCVGALFIGFIFLTGTQIFPFSNEIKGPTALNLSLIGAILSTSTMITLGHRKIKKLWQELSS